MAVNAINPYEVLVDGVEVSKVELQALLAEINTRLGGIVLAPASVDTGTAVVYGDDGAGPAPASAGVRPVLYARRQLGSFRPQPFNIDANMSLTDVLHVGRLGRKKTASAATLTLNLHSDPTIGVADGFACTLLRYQGSGDLQIISSMTNQHSESHTRVSEGGIATLYVDSEVGWFLMGNTEV